MAAPINLADFEPMARERMDPAAWDYYAGGADDEVSLRENRDAFGRLRLRPRVLRDVSTRDLSVRALGRELEHPIIVAPTAAHHLGHPDGELASARGAAAAGALFTLSTISGGSLEEVASVAPDAPRWFQLYTSTDPEVNRSLMERAAAAGYGAVVVTVDLPIPGNRERDARHSFVVDLGVHLPPSQPVDEHGLVITATLDWEALAELRSACPIPMLVKGMLRADDALRAAEAGCDGIWVSNHGGRQLDTAIAGIDALPDIVAAVGERTLVVVDGGVRRGTDVLKALALGAHLVGLGRPVLWGLAVDGADGVQHVIEILRAELSLAMALSGCRNIGEITPDLIA
jgi:4-hydroxymandelate oxidase